MVIARTHLVELLELLQLSLELLRLFWERTEIFRIEMLCILLLDRLIAMTQIMRIGTVKFH